MSKTRRVYPKVLLKNPSIKSRAALILLYRKYGNLMKQYKPDWRIWLSFRNRYFKKQLRRGPLTCAYCGLSPLYKNSRITPDEFKATVDHVYPQSKGGSKFSESNLAVCCTVCNHEKGNKLLEDDTWGRRYLCRW